MTSPEDLGVFRGVHPVNAQGQFAVVAALLTPGNPPPELISELVEWASIIKNPRKSTQADEDEDRALLASVRSLEQRLVFEVHLHELIEKKWPSLPVPLIFDTAANILFELAQYLEEEILRPPRRAALCLIAVSVSALGYVLIGGVVCAARSSPPARTSGPPVKPTGRHVVTPQPATRATLITGKITLCGRGTPTADELPLA